ncbi:hypothetical protein Q1695_005774 [Nippostrongylus brasiliensis]|nr:hypothetical protein Q1695_005774 [Nippostrongylus brasiliensis]
MWQTYAPNKKFYGSQECLGSEDTKQMLLKNPAERMSAQSAKIQSQMLILCKTCQKKLAGLSFFNIDNRPTCKPCYEATLEKCKKCGNKIADRLLRAHGDAYHVECFTCTGCSRTLDGVPFTTDPQDNVYCVTCYQDKFAPRCAVCNKPIVPKDGEKESVRVIAMDKSFHPSCYKCEDCGMQLSSKVEGAACYPLNSHLNCKTCNGNRLRAQAAA